MTPCGDTDIGEHWLRYWIVAWRHLVITWSNVVLSPEMLFGIHVKGIAQDIRALPHVSNLCSEITLFVVRLFKSAAAICLVSSKFTIKTVDELMPRRSLETGGILWRIFIDMQYFSYRLVLLTWWRHQMKTFSALLAICAGNSPVTGEFLAQKPVTRSFDVFFDLRLNKPLSKQWWGWGFETLPRPLWRHCNELLPSARDRRVNSLQPSDTICRHKSGSTSARVKTCCLTAPSHYLDQC